MCRLFQLDRLNTHATRFGMFMNKLMNNPPKTRALAQTWHALRKRALLFRVENGKDIQLWLLYVTGPNILAEHAGLNVLPVDAADVSPEPSSCHAMFWLAHHEMMGIELRVVHTVFRHLIICSTQCLEYTTCNLLEKQRCQ